MKQLLTKAAKYAPDVLVEFILQVEKELDLENKALFKAILVDYFLSDTLAYIDELNPKIKDK